MATSSYPIPVGNLRAVSGVFADDLDTNLSKWVMRFNDSATQQATLFLPVPRNWVTGNGTFTIRWRSLTATSGDVKWSVTPTTHADNATPVLGSAIYAVTTTAATAGNINESTFTIPLSAADRLVALLIARVGGDAADTMVGDAEVLQMTWSYPSDPMIAQLYIWVPVNAMAIPVGSGAVLGTSTHVNGYYVMTFRDAQSDYADFKVVLPSSYSGTTITANLWQTHLSDTVSGDVVWRLNAAETRPGYNNLPTLTTGTPTAKTLNANKSANAKVPVPVTPAAGSELLCRLTRLGSDGGDTLAADAGLLGVCLEVDLVARNPGIARLEPASGSLPAGAASVMNSGDSSTNRWIVRFNDGVTQSIDLINWLPGTYSGGGTLKLRWRSSAAGNVVWRVASASPAVGSNSDPALSTPVDQTATNLGSGLVNETTFDISSGLVAGDEVQLRLSRMGGDAADTLAGDVDLLDVWLEVTIGG